jgi:hypothetical protein
MRGAPVIAAAPGEPARWRAAIDMAGRGAGMIGMTA